MVLYRFRENIFGLNIIYIRYNRAQQPKCDDALHLYVRKYLIGLSNLLIFIFLKSAFKFTMNDQKQEGKLSLKNKGFVLAGLTILLLGVVLLRIKFPALRNELSTVLFIATLLVMGMNIFRSKE